MTKYLVSINGAPSREAVVQPRTQRVVPGVLCEVAINGTFELCLVDRVGPVQLDVRRLPNAGDRLMPRVASAA